MDFMPEPAPTVQQLLAFYLEAGVDCALGDDPIDRLAEPDAIPAAAGSVAPREVAPPRGLRETPAAVPAPPRADIALAPEQAIAATRICARFSQAHGAPVHRGDPAAIGINNLAKPDFGDPVEVKPNEVAVFWACGVTPQAALQQATGAKTLGVLRAQFGPATGA